MEPSTVVSAVNQKKNDQEMFTGWDITSDLRAATDDNIDHHGVKDIVHNTFKATQNLSGAYEKKIIPTPGGTAWLYYPKGSTMAEIKTYVRGLEWGNIDAELAIEKILGKDDDVDSAISSLVQHLEID